MTPTRLTLTRDLDDLHKGQQGIMVIAKEHASIDGVPCPYTWTGYFIDVKAVLFDGYSGPAIGRMVDGKYLMVKDYVTASN